jgi:hypothetical protein
MSAVEDGRDVMGIMTRVKNSGIDGTTRIVRPESLLSHVSQLRP